MYETLLVLHVFAAFALGITTVIYVAVALGAPTTPRARFLADRLWDVGGLGTLVFGVWLALYVDGYEIWDGWILAALVLWFVATGIGARTGSLLAAAAPVEAAAVAVPATETDAQSLALWHWLRAATVVAILFLMIFKPGA